VARRKAPPKDKHKVGYGRPPLHTRFQKGHSGNPSGRPRAEKGVQAEQIILKEANRLVQVREGENVVVIPALQAVVRGIIVNAAKGNGPAQRLVIAVVQAIQQKEAAQEAAKAVGDADQTEMSEIELGRRIAFAMEKAARAEKPNPGRPQN
jgi:Family of unknown function (DUF5681)